MIINNLKIKNNYNVIHKKINRQSGIWFCLNILQM